MSILIKQNCKLVVNKWVNSKVVYLKRLLEAVVSCMVSPVTRFSTTVAIKVTTYIQSKPQVMNINHSDRYLESKGQVLVNLSSPNSPTNIHDIKKGLKIPLYFLKKQGSDKLEKAGNLLLKQPTALQTETFRK